MQTPNFSKQKSKIYKSNKIGDDISAKILPNDVLNLQFSMPQAVYVKFNLTIDKMSNIGIYAERNVPPTFTKFSFFEKLNSGESLIVNTGFVHFLEDGIWYLTLLNDNEHVLCFSLKTEFYEYSSRPCPLNCNGKGECGSNGKCECFPGFGGRDCSLVSCPVLCSAHGYYENGKCSCFFDWHGSECQVPRDQCEMPDCNGNGVCGEKGRCRCFKGFEGKFCEKQSCNSPNGVFLEEAGKCVCFANYTGFDCGSVLVQSIDSICSNHGNFSFESRQCKCEHGWQGPQCFQSENCIDKTCVTCINGWSGPNCLTQVPLKCDTRCNQHGLCLNGTCQCSPGYQGRNCDINSCPNSCSSNGVCELLVGSSGIDLATKYECVCEKGWSGKACEQAKEMICNDGLDNDHDGLTDCMDSECCVFDNCKLSLACQTSPEPKDRLLRKQPPSLSASFFEKVRFLIEDGSVQSFANGNSFSENQVSVIRGQVLYKNGQPLIGVKVSSKSHPSYGYTLTRNNGIFDLMVNGGGTIMLEFSKSQLKTELISVNPIWNQFVHVDPIVMYLSTDSNPRINPPVIDESTCNNSFNDISPKVYSSWKQIRSNFYDSSPSQMMVLADSGVLRNELEIADSKLKLVYMSSQVHGYLSTIFVLLTQQQIPQRLQLVHLKIVVEGLLFKQTFEAYENLKYEFAWDRRNAYEQRVYGFAYAKVMCGYQFEGCENIFWQSSVVKLAGYDLGSSEIGNWNLHVHHRLNTQEGILHKGDGTTIYLKEIQKNIEIAAGEMKKKRDIELDASDKTTTPRFYSPYSLSINKDGVVFVADYNCVWMLNGTEGPSQVLKLRNDQPYKFYLANDPTSGKLFLSDSTNRLILSVNNLHTTQTHAQDLQYPKSIAFDNLGQMYFIDANQIKLITLEGILKILTTTQTTQLNHPNDQCGHEKVQLKLKKFYWPTMIAINPIDNTLYVLDEGVIYKIDNHNQVEIIAGLPLDCNHGLKLHNPVDMAFSSDGDLFVLENDPINKIKQIRLIKSNGDAEVYFGYGSGQSLGGYDSFDYEYTTSRDDILRFNDPCAIAVHQNRSVYILDKGDLVLYHVRRQITKDEFNNGKYTIVSPETKEAYLFNRFGMHMHTVNLVTGKMMFNFTYNGNAFYGKLTQVTDQSSVLLDIKRNFHGRAELLQTSESNQIKITLNNFGMLKAASTNTFDYFGNTGLLKSKGQSDDLILFEYQKNGKIERITDSRIVTNITYFVNSSGIITSINKADHLAQTWVTNSSGTFIYKNSKLDLVVSTNTSDFKMRSLSNDVEFDSFRLYYKSFLNFKQLSASAIASRYSLK